MCSVIHSGEHNTLGSLLFSLINFMRGKTVSVFANHCIAELIIVSDI